MVYFHERPEITDSDPCQGKQQEVFVSFPFSFGDDGNKNAEFIQIELKIQWNKNEVAKEKIQFLLGKYGDFHLGKRDLASDVNE